MNEPRCVRALAGLLSLLCATPCAIAGPWGETVCVLPTGVSHCRAARLQVLFYGYCAQTSELSLRVLAEDRRGQDPLPILVGLTPGYGAAAHPSMGAGGIAPRQWCDVTLSTCCHLPLRHDAMCRFRNDVACGLRHDVTCPFGLASRARRLDDRAPSAWWTVSSAFCCRSDGALADTPTASNSGVSEAEVDGEDGLVVNGYHDLVRPPPSTAND